MLRTRAALPKRFIKPGEQQQVFGVLLSDREDLALMSAIRNFD
jgi:hypothetical protein